VNRTTATLVATAMLAISATAAHAAAPTPVPDAKANLGSMAFYVGTWNCKSTVRGAHRTNTTTYTMDYNGRWLKAHDIAPPFDKYRKRAIMSDTWTGYNADSHQWVQTFLDDFGNYGTSTSPGWSGNKITFTVVLSNDGSTGSDTLTKVSDTETTDTTVGKNKDGTAQPSVTTVCKKS
jgi:hypothetical protein